MQILKIIEVCCKVPESHCMGVAKFPQKGPERSLLCSLEGKKSMLPWRAQDVRDVKTMGHLLSKGTGIE